MCTPRNQLTLTFSPDGSLCRAPPGKDCKLDESPVGTLVSAWTSSGAGRYMRCARCRTGAQGSVSLQALRLLGNQTRLGGLSWFVATDYAGMNTSKMCSQECPWANSRSTSLSRPVQRFASNRPDLLSHRDVLRCERKSLRCRLLNAGALDQRLRHATQAEVAFDRFLLA